jgi:hypothetical protein
LGAFFAAVAFLLALDFAGAPLAACAPPLAFVPAFGFAGSGASLAVSAKPWKRSQIRLAAVLVFLNVLTGATPGRLFQVATSRSAGQPPTSSASSFWLAKESKGVAVEAAASSAEPNAVIVFSLSIVNVGIIVLLGAALCAAIT